MSSASFNWHAKLRESDMILFKKGSFPSQELIRPKHDQSIVERTLQCHFNAWSRSRSLNAIGLLLLKFLTFRNREFINITQGCSFLWCIVELGNVS